MNFPRNASLRFHDAEGLEIRVSRGIVWITQDGDIRDIVVKAGQSFRLDRGGKAFLEVLQDAEIAMVHRPVAGRAPRVDAIAKGFRGSLVFMQESLQAAFARRRAPYY